MDSLIKLQLKTVFKSPTPYLLIFVLMPILYVLCASFLPAALVLPGIIVTMIASVTFFVFGASLMQVKNSVVYKRLEVNGLSKSKFVLSNGLLSIAFSIIGVYFLIEFFGTINALGNWDALFLENNEINNYIDYISSNNLFVPMHLKLFFIDDLVNTLDDAVWLMLADLTERLSRILQATPNLFIMILESLNNIVQNGEGLIATAIWKYLQGLVEEITGNHINKDDFDILVTDLISRIEGGQIYEIANALSVVGNGMHDSFYENGHAPLNIISSILSPVPDDGSENGYIYIDGDSTILSARPIYNFYWINPENGVRQHMMQLFYIHYAPTLSTLLSPFLDWNTRLDTGGHQIMLLTFWIEYFFIICLLALMVYAMMIVFVSAARNFEQYILFSGVTLIAIMLCSGLFLPFFWILATPMLFMMLSLFPTTSLVFQMQSLWRSEDILLYPAQQTINPLWSYGYPLLIITALFAITLRLLTNENGKLTTKFIHDGKSKKSTLVNIIVNLVIIFGLFFYYYHLILVRTNNVTNSNNPDFYPSNFKMFIPQLMLVIYVLLLFSNFIYLFGKSQTFYKHGKLFATSNAILLFPIGVITAITSQTGTQIEKKNAN